MSTAGQQLDDFFRLLESTAGRVTALETAAQKMDPDERGNALAKRVETLESSQNPLRNHIGRAYDRLDVLESDSRDALHVRAGERITALEKALKNQGKQPCGWTPNPPREQLPDELVKRVRAWSEGDDRNYIAARNIAVRLQQHIADTLPEPPDAK